MQRRLVLLACRSGRVAACILFAVPIFKDVALTADPAAMECGHSIDIRAGIEAQSQKRTITNRLSYDPMFTVVNGCLAIDSADA